MCVRFVYTVLQINPPYRLYIQRLSNTLQIPLHCFLNLFQVSNLASLDKQCLWIMKLAGRLMILSGGNRASIGRHVEFKLNS
jgi:hypothetical protein